MSSRLPSPASVVMRWSRQYHETRVELGADVWEYRFEVYGPGANATGEATQWHPGPRIEARGRD